MSCIFCRIVDGSIPSRKVYEDEDVLAFHDLHPVAPVHVLLIPKVHVESIGQVHEMHESMLGKLLLAAGTVGRMMGVDDEGYRLVANTNEDGGQTVYHLHFHLMGGRPMNWPPG